MSSCLRLCTAASCRSRGATALLQHADQPVKEVGCLGPCSEGPLAAMGDQLLSLQPAGHQTLGPTLEAALAQSREISAKDPFLKLQRRLVLARCGLVDTGCIEDALAHGAYQQLQAVLAANDPSGVIETVRRSGLRGRGGAGYPTGLKWATVAAMPGEQKRLVCNADEGDPGAFMDRTLMEGDPHTLLEGMAIAAFAVGAQQGYIYVRAEYPLAIERLRAAIAAAEARGWLGRAIAESDFSFEIELRVGAGAYVCG